MKVVAFSYSIGSFGKLVAMDLAQNMDLSLVSFDDIYQLGLERSLNFQRRHQDKAEGRGDIDIWEGHFFSHPEYTSLFESIVLERAGQGQAVLMGFGAQAVLRPFPGVLRVHVEAPLELRIKRFMDLHQITMHEANQTIKWWDMRQRSLFEFGTIFNAADKDSHDLRINTERISIPSASRLIAKALNDLPSAPEPAVWQSDLKRLSMAKKVECAVREISSAIGLAPLEVRPAEGTSNNLMLSGFVHTQQDLDQAVSAATEVAGDWPVQSQLKILRLHSDLAPPRI